MTLGQAVVSIDFELFSHLPAYRQASGEAETDSAVLAGAESLLSELDRQTVYATFFVVSEIAERYPDVVSRLGENGHEIGSHTRTHRHLSGLTKAQRRRELADSRTTLESVGNEPVKGFRAPSFDVPRGHFDQLAATGYQYDSSIAPCRSIPGWYGGNHNRQRPGSASDFETGAPDDIAELPIGVFPGIRLPLTGTWLRFFGVRYTVSGMRWLASRGIPPVLYVHPWEFAELPMVEGVPKRVYWRTGDWMGRALRIVLDQPFEFVPARSVVER